MWSAQTFAVGCYQMSCALMPDGFYNLEIMDPLGAWHTCQPSKNISVLGYAGNITCPDEWQSLCAPPSYESIRSNIPIADRLAEANVRYVCQQTPVEKPCNGQRRDLLRKACHRYGYCREERTWQEITDLQMDLGNPVQVWVFVCFMPTPHRNMTEHIRL